MAKSKNHTNHNQNRKDHRGRPEVLAQFAFRQKAQQKAREIGESIDVVVAAMVVARTAPNLIDDEMGVEKGEGFFPFLSNSCIIN
uniref:Uncharacterized protein n=1 Tax=Globodera rostochiensis TaxID=31243 RepID=A0A914GVK6_GLORO